MNNSSILARTISIFVGWGLALQAFNTIYWPDYLGYFSSSPGVPILFIAATLTFLKKSQNTTSKYAWLMIAWGFVASLSSLALFGANELYITKFVPLLILSISWLAPILCLDALSARMLKISLAAGLIVTAVGYIFSDLLPDALPSGLRAIIFGGGHDVYFDARPRAFMEEPSHLAALVGRYGLILILLFDIDRRYSGRRMIIRALMLAGVLMITGSKGAALSVAAMLLMLGNGWRGLPYIVFLAAGSQFFIDSQISAFNTDIEHFTSTATRLGLWLAGLGAIATNPIGWGYYGFYGAVDWFGNWSVSALSHLQLVFTEFQSILDERANVSFKSTLVDFGAVFGWPFWVFLVYVLRRINLSDPRARCATVYFVISGASTAGHESISLFLGLAVLLRFYPRVALPSASPPHAKVQIPNGFMHWSPKVRTH